MAEPVRMCRVCRRRAAKAKLRRWVLVEGQLHEDIAQRLTGRGYYTDTPECATRLPKVLKLGNSL